MRNHLTAFFGLGAALAFVAPNPTRACGFHPQLQGGFQISYPGALDVAVAVADARRRNVLPAQRKRTGRPAAAFEFQTAMSDLKRLQAHLDTSRQRLLPHENRRFSIVLVGPSLWSNFHVAPAAVMARYHATGPIDDEPVVLTHRAALHALMRGHIALRDAVASRLIVFSGQGATDVQSVFETSFEKNRSRIAAPK